MIAESLLTILVHIKQWTHHPEILHINSLKNEINDNFIDFFIKEVILPCHGGQI